MSKMATIKKAGEGLLAVAVRTIFEPINGVNTRIDMPMVADHKAFYQSDAKIPLTILVEMSASTSVTMNSYDFKRMLRLVVMQSMLLDCHSLDDLLRMPFVGSGCIADSVQALAEKFSEPISIKRFVRVDGPVGIYLHNNLKQAAIIELDGVSQNDEIGNELAMHVVFAKPKYLSRSDVPSDILDKMNKEQMDKFFCTYCLLDQPYYHEKNKTVEAILKAEHPDAKIKAFHLVIVGEENDRP